MKLVYLAVSLALVFALSDAKAIEDNDIGSLAVRMLQEAILNSEAPTDNIPEVAKKLNLTTLVDLVDKAKLTRSLEAKGPFTLFGPTNKAFDDLPQWAKDEIETPSKLHEFLTYHVLQKAYKSKDLKNDLVIGTLEGKKLRINIYENKTYTAQCKTIRLSAIDKEAANGVIHELDAVMIPPAGNAVTTLYRAKAFKTLLEALMVADLTETLTGPGPFTVFAPTDKAFGKLPPDELAKLLKDKKYLKEVLLYHVLKGTACSPGLKSGHVKTINGQDVQIQVSKDGVKVNNAKVVFADVSIDNGVVHSIDTVLFPKNNTMVYYL